MKLVTLLILCCVVIGCSNTMNGMHQDWRNGTQSVANSTGN